MKILHIADLHLGKKLCAKSRLDEQEAVLDEIYRIAKDEQIDVIVAAGDIFDTTVPCAEAEELFYKSVLRFSSLGACFVAIAGNHDDAQRLKAPSGIAKPLDIFLVGGYDNEVYSKKNITGGDGYLKIMRGGQTLNLALMPYPQHSVLAAGEDKGKSYTQLVKDKLDKICSCFSDNEINVLAAHLFVAKGGQKNNDDLSDERELGTAALLPDSILPDCDYVALGHIHKPMTVSTKRNIYYSGSMLGYSFDDLSNKSVVIAEIVFENNVKTTKVKRVPLISAKKLVRADCKTVKEAEQILKENADGLVLLLYNGDRAIKSSELKELKRYNSFVRFDNTFVEKRTKREFRVRSDSELFIDFYKQKNGTEKAPPSELVDMFLKVLSGEEV